MTGKPEDAKPGIILGFVSTAVNKRAIGERLRIALDAKVVDVDRILCDARKTKEALRASGRREADATAPLRMRTIIQHLPRTEVLSLWTFALHDALVALKNDPAEGPKVLLCGAMYHSKRRSEFYSPFDFATLAQELAEQELTLKRVAMFIDDVFDMYHRLAVPDELYDPALSVEEEYGRLLGTEHVDAFKLSIPRQALVAMEVLTGELVRLLHWRQLEVTMAERVARSFAKPYLLWGVKQDIRGLEPWLTGSASAVTYVSHPISRPRREHARLGDWGKIVDECNDLQGQLAALSCTAVMPTAIDEYRLEHAVTNRADRRGLRRPKLVQRWPLIGKGMGLLYQAPDADDAPNFQGIFTPRRLQERVGLKKSELIEVGDLGSDFSMLDPPLRFFEREVAAQVAARDHTIVANTDHTIVFRPFFNDAHFSRGVVAEIGHWADLARTDVRRRIAFLHRNEDLENRVSGIDLADELRRSIGDVVLRECGGDQRAAAQTMAIADQRLPRAELLDRGPENSERRGALQLLQKATSAAPEELVWRMLGSHGEQISEMVNRGQIGVWVISDDSNWSDVFPEVVRFLADGNFSTEAFRLALSRLSRAAEGPLC